MSSSNSSPDSGPKSAKKKLTKSDKAKVKKEEAERKLKEEEEARVRAAEEDEVRKVQEEKDLAERQRLEAEERVRRKGQLEELDAIWNTCMSNIRNDLELQHAEAKWQRYMRCDGTPDPTIAGEINSYINLSHEDRASVDIDSVLRESTNMLALIDELEHILVATPSEEISEKETKMYKQTRKELQTLLKTKLDLASHDLLLKSSLKADSETNNLQQVISDGVNTLCLWGNLIKNPRIKSFEFPDVAFQFEIPRVLTMTDCAVRVLFCVYDHYSEHCRSFLPRIKQKQHEPVTIEIEGLVEEGEKTEAGEGEAENEKEQTDDQDPEEDVMTALRTLGDDKSTKDEEAEKDEEKDAEKDAEAEQMEQDETTQNVVEFEDFDGNDDVLDMRASQVMGGTFTFDLLNMPPQPKNVNNWTLNQIIEPAALSYLDYVADEAETVDEANQRVQSATSDKKEEKPPITIHMRLPSSVFFCEEPQVARWNADECVWNISGFRDQVYNEDNRTLSFKTTAFGTLCLVQDAHINMPFQSWELRPRGVNNAILTVIAAISEVEMEVKDAQIRLLQPEKEELQHLVGKWMSLDQFIKQMRSAGLNIFPDEDTFKYVSIQNKSAQIEENVYRQMAMTSSSMAYSWSKWNIEVNNPDQIVIQGAEQLEDEHLLEEDWSLYNMTRTRSTKLKMTEFDDIFSEDHAEGTEFHSDLYHTTMQLASNEGQERITSTSYGFVNAIYRLLSATKLITYS